MTPRALLFFAALLTGAAVAALILGSPKLALGWATIAAAIVFTILDLMLEKRDEA